MNDKNRLSNHLIEAVISNDVKKVSELLNRGADPNSTLDTATQYALFSAVTAVGRIFVGPIAAVVVEHVGWVQFYVWSFIIGLPSLLILWWLKHRVDFTAEQLSEA